MYVHVYIYAYTYLYMYYIERSYFNKMLRVFENIYYINMYEHSYSSILFY